LLGIRDFNKVSGVAKLLVLSVAIISFVGLGLRNLAVSQSSATLVTSLGGFQSLFVLLFAIAISFKFPDILKEELKGRIIGFKIIAIILLAIGIYFISL